MAISRFYHIFFSSDLDHRLKKLPDPRPSRNIRFCASQKLSAEQKIEITNNFYILKKSWFSFSSEEIILNFVFNIE